MSLTLETLAFLTSPAGERLLARLVQDDLDDSRTLYLIGMLRRDASPEQAGAALELARLRRQAADKFGDDAPRLWFTRAALEQASDPLARRYRAQFMAGQAVVDAGCGLGADTLAFAGAGAQALGVDIDPVRVALARLNAAALGVNARFEVGDVRDGLPAADCAFFDPARRDAQGRRLHHVEAYQPPLSIIRGWPHPQIVVKLSPGVALEQVAGYGGGLEFISVRGDLKEAVLWLGSGFAGRRATLLTDAAAYHWEHTGPEPELCLSAPRAWLVEPDPALLRAGLVRAAAAACGGGQLDADIAYFTTDARPDSPWLRAWRILDWMPYQLKRLRAYLRAHCVGRVTVKKRGSAITPEALTAGLKLRGDETRTLVLTRWQNRPIVLICADADTDR